MRRQPTNSDDNTLFKHASPPKPRLAVRVGVDGYDPNNSSDTSVSLVGQQLTKVLCAVEHAAHSILKDEPDVYAQELSEFRLVSRITGGRAQPVPSTVPVSWLIESVFTSTNVEKDRVQQNEAVGYLAKTYSTVRFPTQTDQTLARIESNAINYFLRQIDLLIVIWNGAAQSSNAVAAVARQAFDSGVPVVWISTDGPHPPRLLVDFDKSGNALASETDCTEGPLAFALSPIVGGPKAKVDRSGISPKEGLQNFYSESWHPHCYSTAYDILRRVTTFRWPRAVIKTRAYSDQCCDWDRFFAAAPETGPLKERLRNILCPRFVWADTLAVYYSHKYRSAYIRAYALSALAVFAGLAGIFIVLGYQMPNSSLANAELLSRYEICAAGVEFALLGLAIWAIWRGRKGLWLERWLDYRALAESLRHTRFLAFLSEFGAVGDLLSEHGKTNLSWPLWYLRATMRELGLPTAVLNSIYHWKILNATLAHEIDEQIRYHEDTRNAVSRINAFLHILGIICILLTLFVLALFLSGGAYEYFFGEETLLGHIPYYLQPWLVFVSAGLPALGAALAAIRVHGEFESSEQRSALMIDSLKALKTDYETALRRDSDSEATAKRLIRASRVMSEDLAAWEELYGRKRLELPA